MTSRDPQFADGKAERLQSVVTTSEESQSSNGQLPTGWIGMRMKPVARGEASNSGSSRDGGYRSSASEEAVEVSRSMDSASDDALYEVRSEDELLPTKGEPFESRNGVVQRTRSLNEGGEARDASPMMYKLYKRRWFGLIQLTLLNIIVSWNWLSFSPVSTTSSQYFNVTVGTINWLSTAFLFAFIVAAPPTIYTLHRGGPRMAILISSLLLLAGNWIRYGGAKSNSFGVVMFGQILTGFAQPFVLAAPTRYSDLWFTGNGRVAATALMSLANPFGGALGQLIDPFWATEPSDIPDMVLWIAVIATIASIPSFFIPAKPPTPCSHASEVPKLGLIPSIKALLRSPEIWMISYAYAVLVGLFNSISSLLNQILEPYGFTETDAGIAGALLIVVGLVFAAISSPIIDRTKKFLLFIKILVPVVALCYLVFIWAPPSKSLAAVYVVLSVMGAASFSLVPVALEYLTEISHPISPELTSTVCWSGGQLLGGIFILISDALTDGPHGGSGGSTPYNMQRALWFQAILAMLSVPPPLALGFFGRQKHVKMRRAEADEVASRRNTSFTNDHVDIGTSSQC